MNKAFLVIIFLVLIGLLTCSLPVVDPILRTTNTFKVLRTVQSGTCDYGYALAIESDGSFVVTGHSEDQALLMRADSCGDTGVYFPTVTTNMLGRRAIGYDIIVAAEGGYVITGSTILEGRTDEDIFIIKYSANGIFQWYDIYGSNSKNEIAYAIDEIPGGGYVLTGSVFDPSTGDEKMLLLTADVIGNLTQIYEDKENNTGGYDVLAESAQLFIIAGKIFDGARILSLNATGEIFVDKNIANFQLGTKGYSIIPTKDDGYLISGEKVSGPTQDKQIFLWKVNSSGDWIEGPWLQKLEESNTYYTPISSNKHRGGLNILEEEDGYVFVGNVDAPDETYSFIRKIDMQGNTLWTEKLASNVAWIYGLSGTLDDGYIICGESGGQFADFSDVLLIKTNDRGIRDNNCN